MIEITIDQEGKYIVMADNVAYFKCDDNQTAEMMAEKLRNIKGGE